MVYINLNICQFSIEQARTNTLHYLYVPTLLYFSRINQYAIYSLIKSKFFVSDNLISDSVSMIGIP